MTREQYEYRLDSFHAECMALLVQFGDGVTA
jgi:hypothetical protein